MQTQRDIFWDWIYLNTIESLSSNSNGDEIVVVSADMGAPALDKFRRHFPGRYIDVGIAEQHAISLAAGLAKEGKIPFVYAIAPFVSLRVIEQIRNSVVSMRLPVRIVGVGAGFSYDDSGPTHHTVEDFSMLRALNNLQIYTITDNRMAKWVADQCCMLNQAVGPVYIRLDRKPLPPIYSEKDVPDFSNGFGFLPPDHVNGGFANDYVIIANGNMVYKALEVAQELRSPDRNFFVIDLFSRYFNEDLFMKRIWTARRIFTMEEHVLDGGLGSLVLETLSRNDSIQRVVRYGIDFKDGYCYTYGGREQIQRRYGLDKDSLVRSINDKIQYDTVPSLNEKPIC